MAFQWKMGWVECNQIKLSQDLSMAESHALWVFTCKLLLLNFDNYQIPNMYYIYVTRNGWLTKIICRNFIFEY